VHRRRDEQDQPALLDGAALRIVGRAAGVGDRARVRADALEIGEVPFAGDDGQEEVAPLGRL
jgi:hypothetical protein